jgi:hypothetical protein
MTPPAVNSDHVTDVQGGNSTSYVVVMPTHTQGDIIYIAIVQDGSGATLTQASFTKLYNVSIGVGATFALFYKTAGASEPASYTVTTDVSERAVWICWSVNNDGGIHAQATNASSSGTTASVNAITTTADNCLIFSIIATDGISTPMGNMAGHAKLDEISFTSAASLGVYYQAAAFAGMYASASATLSASEGWIGVRFAVVAAAQVAVTTGRKLPSHSDSRALTVAVFEPLALGTAQIDNISAAINDYSHEIAAMGGYMSARIRINGRQVDLEDWYERGLGRRIVTYSPDGLVVWEGFVNTVKLALGPLSKTIGPLTDIANRVRLVHSFISAGGQDIGLRLSTDWTDNTTSQDKYGIFERVLSTGGASTTTADQLRDQYLAENVNPPRSEEWTLGGSGVSMELECAGYVRLMEHYAYNNATVGAQNLSVKLAAVIDAEPNNILTSANGIIEANTLQVASKDNENRIAWNIIKELVAQGDASFNETIFGIYAGRQAQYQAVVEQDDYLQALSDTAQQVTTPGGAVVEPWYVLPGKWLRVTDFLIGRIPDTTELRDDPRYMFIESVQFTAPYSLSLRGGKIDKLPQRLARLGLSGIGG